MRDKAVVALIDVCSRLVRAKNGKNFNFIKEYFSH